MVKLSDQMARMAKCIDEHGPVTGADVARIAEVPRSGVYAQLKRLESAGVVVSSVPPDPTSGPPRRYYSIADGVVLGVEKVPTTVAIVGAT